MLKCHIVIGALFFFEETVILIRTHKHESNI